MFEAHPFVTAQDIGWHLTLETGIHASGVHRHMMTQKAHDVWALKGAQAVEHEGAVHSGQVAPILKEQVGGVFALGDTPVIIEVGKRLEDFLLQGMGRCEQLSEQLQPVGLLLRVGQGLSAGRVSQSRPLRQRSTLKGYQVCRRT